MSAYLHSLRRRWLLVTCIAVPCAVWAGLAVAWATSGDQYTATALLRIKSSEGTVIANRGTQESFSVYKATQRVLITSDLVIAAALDKLRDTKLPIVQQNENNPERAIADGLTIVFPENAEILRVSFTSSDRGETAKLVNAVVEAYMSEAVNTNQNEKKGRLKNLEVVFVSKSNELREKQNTLKGLVDQLGLADSTAIRLSQHTAVQLLGEYQRQIMAISFDLYTAQVKCDLAKAAVSKTVDDIDVSEKELDSRTASDSTSSQMFFQLTQLEQLLEVTESVDLQGQRTEELRGQLKEIKELYEARRNELLTRLKHGRHEESRVAVARLESQIQLLKTQMQMFEQKLVEQRQEVAKYGGSSFDVDMMKDEIEDIKGVLARVSERIQVMKIESLKPFRVSLMQKASRPKTPDDNPRLAKTALATLMGLMLPAFGIVWWENRTHRISSSTEVSNGLSLSVLGSVPLVPRRFVGASDSSSVAGKYWHSLLAKSVDGIVAMLLCGDEREQDKVILVSSASAGEGKTTLAVQLAMSLGRSGRRTMLIDFDLYKPAIHKVFGLQMEPGVGEILSHEKELEQVVQPSLHDNLSVITAGRWNKNVTEVLSNSVSSALFEKLRADYEFVIVDTAPILPSAETRLVGQYVDGAILSVLRDVSQAPKVLAASELLARFGIRSLGAVVTGAGEAVYYDYK